MKRRLVRLMLIGLTAIALTGCSNLSEVIPPSNDEDIEETDDTDEDDDDIDDENDDDDQSSHTGVAHGNSNYILARSPLSDTFYMYNSESDSLMYIDRYEIAAKSPNVNPDIYRLYNEYEYYRSTLVGEGDGFLFFRDSVVFEEGGDSQSIVYAVRLDDYKIYDVWRNSGNGYMGDVEFYDGRVYIDYTLGYDDSYRSLGDDVISFEYDPKSDSFVEAEVNAELKKIVQKSNELEAHIRSNDVYCYAHVFDDCGYLPAVKDGELILINAAGKTVTVPGFEDGYNACYDETHVFTVLMDYDTGVGKAYVYDIKTGETTEVSEGNNANRVLGKNGTKYYYNVSSDEEYGIDHNYIYEYDSKSGINKLLYDVKFAPGSDIAPGIEGFTLTDSFIYYIGFDEGSIFWVPVEIDNPTDEYPRIDLGSDSLFYYGSIGYVSNTYECPDCATDLVCTYAEYPILGEYVSENVDKINEYMLGIAQQAADADLNQAYESPCEDHSQYPTHYTITDDHYVSNIAIICDGYLTIDMTGYWYGGGAHGMPSRVQYLFDTNTGELKTLSDFYPGTEEDFKALVAEKTKEHFLSYDDDDFGTPYFAADAETVYEQAYNYVSLNSGTIEFTDEGIIFFYPPYEMGPYASGFIDIKISYDELLGRNSL